MIITLDCITMIILVFYNHISIITIIYKKVIISVYRSFILHNNNCINLYKYYITYNPFKDYNTTAVQILKQFVYNL